MNVSLITRHAIANYGSFLRAYATQQLLEGMGHSCVVVDYVREDEEYGNIEKTLLKQKPEWNRSALKRWIYLSIRKPMSLYSGRRFEAFRRQYLCLSKRYSTKDELSFDKPPADCYMTGSDQVWGPVGSEPYDEVYFLSFTDESDCRFSFAASFGRSSRCAETEERFKQLLLRYSRITVREDSAVGRISEIGLAAEQVLDPTLMLPGEYWKSIAHGRKKAPSDYVLIYQIHNNDKLGRYAKELVRKNGLKLLRVSASAHQAVREGKLILCPDPFEFLSLIVNAKCLITDSFHGTAFAILFNTPFIEVLPDNGTDTRNCSLLRLCGLENRILRSETDYSVLDEAICYDQVNDRVRKERERSLSILESMLGDVKRRKE